MHKNMPRLTHLEQFLHEFFSMISMSLLHFATKLLILKMRKKGQYCNVISS